MVRHNCYKQGTPVLREVIEAMGRGRMRYNANVYVVSKHILETTIASHGREGTDVLEDKVAYLLRHMIKADVDGSELLGLCEVVGLAGIEGDAVSGVLEVEAEFSVRSSLAEPEPLCAFFFLVMMKSVRTYC